MRVVTAETMRALDARAMQEGGMPGVVLMENAGRAVFVTLAHRFAPIGGRLFRVLCGTGNNGGDGFAVARYLALAGARVSVHVAGDPARVQGDAATHLGLLRKTGIEPQTGLPPLEDDACAVVDAILGTGVHGAPRGAAADAIRWMNQRRLPVLAVDIPSGVDSDTGAAPGDAVRADVTVTFGYPKLGMFLPPGADRVGELLVDPIGFPWDALKSDTSYSWTRPEEVASLLPLRPRESHKGMFGHVLVVGGSAGMSGAPTMTAMAAMRSGAGLVTVAAPESAQRLIAGKLDEVMTVPLPETDGALAEAAFDAIYGAAERCDVLCVGPGATRKPEAQTTLLRVLRELDRPTVLDADGLNALAETPDTVRGRKAPLVLTPHPGECARLLATDAGAVQADRVAAARRLALEYRCVGVLKGARTLACDGRTGSENPPTAVNSSGNQGMATGGSGDSLTGIIGSLLGQGLDAWDAARAGVYLHGRAGDIAARCGMAGLVAGDIIEALPEALRELESSR